MRMRCPGRSFAHNEHNVCISYGFCFVHQTGLLFCYHLMWIGRGAKPWVSVARVGHRFKLYVQATKTPEVKRPPLQ